MTSRSRWIAARRWLLACGLLAGLVGCSSLPPMAPVADEGPPAWRDTLAAVPMPDMALSPQVAGAQARAAAVAPRPPMPGRLGTQWGEGRTSEVQQVQAVRLTPERPQAMAQIRYAQAMVAQQRPGDVVGYQNNLLLAGGDVEWALVGANGVALPMYSSGGGRDIQVAGRQGERYELVFANRSRRDYEVVATVDGLDVLTGQPGSVRHGGYLLRAGSTLRIEGFRKSEREVAAFRFATPDRAYAANTPAGRPRDVGVIGAALFEVRLAPREEELRPRPAPSGAAPNPFPADTRYASPPQYGR